ncbi:MAG: hypothetical protein KatS3mg056_2114 [Chloroflexus sp.]|jgi:hypothetical protein|nr:MAG: hypothetical protein KatS3mg056_2114 [Chloroflexus sp.]
MHVEAGSKPASTYVRWGDISNLVLSLVPYPITTPALRLSNALSGKKCWHIPWKREPLARPLTWHNTRC